MVKKHSKEVMIMKNKEHRLTSFLEDFEVYLNLSGFNYTHQEDDCFEHHVI
jgi:hypothetical protein